MKIIETDEVKEYNDKIGDDINKNDDKKDFDGKDKEDNESNDPKDNYSKVNHDKKENKGDWVDNYRVKDVLIATMISQIVALSLISPLD